MKWSKEDDAVLEAVYPHYGTEITARVLNRTISAVQQRASSFFGLKRLPKEERSKDSPEQIAQRVRAEFTPLHVGRPAFTTTGTKFEYGTTAGTKPGLEPVPKAVEHLPWVSYPRDPNTANAVAAACEYMARSEATKKIGPEARRFFESQAAYLRALAQREVAA